MLPKWAWSGSPEQFLHCGLRKFRHSKLSVYRWYTQLDRRRFVYDTSETMTATRSRHGWVHMFITHCLQLNLQLHTIGLVRTCRTSSFWIVAWQLARFQLTRRIARSLGDSWASCNTYMHVRIGNAYVKRCLWHAELGLCRPNGRVSVSPPVCPVDRQQRAAGLLLSAGACSRCRSIAAGTCAQQQMRAASCGEPKDEVQHRLVFCRTSVTYTQRYR